MDALLTAGADIINHGGTALWVAASEGRLAAARVLVRAGARMRNALDLIPNGDPACIGPLLDAPGCMSGEDAGRLRAAVLAGTSERLGPLRQRLLLQGQVACTPSADLGMP